MPTSALKDIYFEEDDLPYEEDILRNPYSVKCWLRYIEHKKEAPKNVINMIYERAIKEMPGSYKLWYNYLKLRCRQIRGRCISDPAHDDVANAYERSLVFMHKMPRIWLDYCQLLMDQCKITSTRYTFDRALRALPITQHHRIWPLYLQLVTMYPLPETAVRVYRRYLKLKKEDTEQYIDYLISIDWLDEAAQRLATIINDEQFVSKKGKSKHQLWNELCDLIAKHPDKVTSLKIEPIIRQGLKLYSDQIGVLWNSMADYYIRGGHFERARDIYEEAIQTVVTVRDFTQVFDAYAQFEKNMVSAKMEAMSDSGTSQEDDLDVELRLARLEHLMDRRPRLLNSVLLRQNPHNVHEWHKRVKLFEGKPREVINTYTEAVQTVDPKLATGKLYTLWVEFAKFYENAQQIDDARIIFEKAIKVPFKHVVDIASVWCEWAEMEIRNENYDNTLKLMQRVTTPPSRKISYHDETETVQDRVHKSLKVWSFYADLEESFGTFKSCKAVYDRIIDLRIATPQIIINYGMFLEENNYYEEAFKAYEKGIALFKWPNVYDIWNTYLTKFIERYGGKKLERARDLFEQCLEGCPPKYAKAIYLLYSKLEEEHGLARHAMKVYDRAIEGVLEEEKHEMFNIYLKKAAEIYGVTHTRSIYEKAIEILADNQSREMCLRFADLERKLGEIDRARAIYGHCSQMCDPRITPDFWKTWKEFEIKHGNEDTVREMLRIKRSVQATYNTQVNFMSAQMLAATNTKGDEPNTEVNEMKKLEEKARQLAEEAVSDQIKPDKGILFVRSNTTDEDLGEYTKTTNPDEINIDDDFDTDEDEEIEEVNLQQQAVPAEVFGSLASEENENDE
ncbi:pre-mRNA-splicing factor SYF1 [Octopus bimaculoides]|uniref:Suppressor of forked domain-containing protein n=1 Tax=Octopus bimaculoides TaxID=37653 RepID=A0A0L8HIW2_OCTBM|nr:pre-mRNA-splicing factor SYF1 [Octopus bimaculoides]|eukprot:XP_014772269.1 PREDICTED: pre-mRNA-splicing factor SYF1-like [Octopus bimaculoides]